MKETLAVDTGRLQQINDYLQSAANPLTERLIKVINSHGGPDEIRRKAREASVLQTRLNRLKEMNSLYLKDVEDEHGKVKPRLVNINSESVQVIFMNNLHYITKEDYRAARKYVKNPEEYDFLKILKWDE